MRQPSTIHIQTFPVDDLSRSAAARFASVSTDTEPERVPFGAGLQIPERISANLYWHGYEAHLDLEVVDGIPTCKRLSFEASAGLSAEMVRDFSLTHAVNLVAFYVAEDPEGGTATGEAALAAYGGAETRAAAVTATRQRRRRITAEVLIEVARVYLDDATGAPTQAVADHFTVSHSTAAKWVTRARAGGHLPATTPGKATTRVQTP